MSSVLNSSFREGFCTLTCIRPVCFSYNWPAQANGVDYGDADEVNTVCETFAACLALISTEEAILEKSCNFLVSVFSLKGS